MRKNILLVSALVIIMLSAFTFLIGNGWAVDPKNVKIKFALAENKHQLSFSDINAELRFDPTDLKNSEMVTRINVNSLQTDDPGLTKHLLTADFFDAEKFPQIKFITTRIEKAEVGYTAYGALAMKDSVHRITLPFTFDQNGNEGVFKGNFSILCSEYGVMQKSKSGADKVIISLEIAVSKIKE